MTALTFQHHLQTTGIEDYHRKVRFQRATNSLPGFLKRLISHLTWDGGLKHMRHFNHDYRFSRNEQGLNKMYHLQREISSGVPIHELLNPIQRPVSLATSGPSALQHDWESLRTSGRMVIAVTGGATFLKQQGITPDLIVVTDPNFCVTGGQHIQDAAGIPLIIEYRAAVSLHTHFPDALKDRPVTFIERINSWYCIPALSKQLLHNYNENSGRPFTISPKPDDLGRIGWSDNINLGFYPSATVAFVALQVLVALGAKDIEIIGMDLGGDTSIYDHARPSKLHENYDRVILPSFEIMGEALQNRGISISNLSLTCRLPDEIFNFSKPALN